MKKYIFPAAVVGLICVLILVGVAFAQSGSQPSPPWYVIGTGKASGGGYYLTSLVWSASGTIQGQGYTLLGPAAPNLRGNGCCCSFLPCVLDNSK
jgi:hypothetical protein